MLIAVPVLKEIVDRPRPSGGLVDAPGRELPQRPRDPFGLLHVAGADGDASACGPGWRYGTALMVGRDRVDRCDRTLARVSRRSLPQRRQRRMGAGRLRVHDLRRGGDGRHAHSAESHGLMPIVAKIGTEYYLFGGAGLVSLVAFAALILVPAVGVVRPHLGEGDGDLRLRVRAGRAARDRRRGGHCDRLLLGRHHQTVLLGPLASALAARAPLRPRFLGGSRVHQPKTPSVDPG